MIIRISCKKFAAFNKLRLDRSVLYMLQRSCGSTAHGNPSEEKPRVASKRSEIIREKTPRGRLDDFVGTRSGEVDGRHRDAEKEPLPKWPNSTNPNTGEVGGPNGPEPTRYGDWERKGRVSDF